MATNQWIQFLNSIVQITKEEQMMEVFRNVKRTNFLWYQVKAFQNIVEILISPEKNQSSF